MLDDLDVINFRHRRVPVVVQLKDFTFRHFIAGFSEDFIDALVLEFHHFAHGSGIEVVANQNTDLVAPHFSGSPPTSPKIGIIHDIVVEQGGGMDELHNAAELMMFGACIPAQACGEEKEQGPEAFPTAAEDMGSDRVDEGDTGIQVFSDTILYPVQFSSVGIPDVGHAIESGNHGTLCHIADGRSAEETKSSQTASSFGGYQILDRGLTHPVRSPRNDRLILDSAVESMGSPLEVVPSRQFRPNRENSSAF